MIYFFADFLAQVQALVFSSEIRFFTCPLKPDINNNKFRIPVLEEYLYFSTRICFDS